MSRIVVIPPESIERYAPLLEAGGWEAAPGAKGTTGVADALGVVRRGDPVLVAPGADRRAGGRSRARLRKVVVVHEGNRGDRAGMDAADDCARASGAEIVVLHVPATTRDPAPGSLAFRIADHGEYDYAEWREEFMRRFCRCSPGVRLTLRVGAASPEPLRDEVRSEKADLVIISGPPIEGHQDDDVLDAVQGAGVPLLIVPSVGRDRSTQSEAERGQHPRRRNGRGARTAQPFVRDIMTREVITVEPSTPLREVARTLVDHQVSGVPVVEPGGKVVGVVTEADVVAGGHGREVEGRPRRFAWLLAEADRPVEQARRVATATAGDAMSAPAITARPNESIEEAARRMSRRRVNRLPVVEKGRLVGIVARADIVRMFLRSDAGAGAGSEPERASAGEPEGVGKRERDRVAPSSAR